MNQDFHYLPVAPNGKEAQMFDFPNKATRSTEDAKRWLAEGKNIGISTTKFNGKEALVVVDVDVKNGKDGNAEIEKLEMLGHEFPETYTQFTPSGGRHLVYRAPKAVKQGKDVLGKGLDIRSKGGYVVASGSKINGVPYTDNGLEPVPCPEWIIKKCGEANEREVAEVDVSFINEQVAIGRATEYLRATAPLAASGDGGDETTYKVAAKVKDFGVRMGTCLELLEYEWNPRCNPPWDREELWVKVKNAYSYGNRPVGADAPEVVFASAPTPEKKEEFYLDKVNKEFALIFLNDGHSILHETTDAKNQPVTKFWPERTFKVKLAPKIAPQRGKGQKQRSIADEWLDWQGRREYQGLCFSPEKPPRAGYYNLWRGFACKPLHPKDATTEQRRGLELFLDHALNNVCESNNELFLWLMGYFAHMIQKPYERPLTTLVFKGLKGTGKNALIDRVGNLLGHGHYLVAHNGRYLTSNFNGHLERCLCLVLDEAFWSGDKAAEGALKSMTTGTTVMIEKKGMETQIIDNLVRIIILGNEEWLVPASSDERRYAVFQMGEGKKQNRAYFKEMRELLETKGGNRVLLHYFQNFDLSKVDVNAAPSTAALHAQKEASLEPFEEWWRDCLAAGEITDSGMASGWPTDVTPTVLWESYLRNRKARNIRGRSMAVGTFGKAIRRLCPGIVRKSKRYENEIKPTYFLPTLAEARALWDKFIGHDTEWSEE